MIHFAFFSCRKNTIGIICKIYITEREKENFALQNQILEVSTKRKTYSQQIFQKSVHKTENEYYYKR